MIPTGSTDLRDWFYWLRGRMKRKKHTSLTPARYYCDGCGAAIRDTAVDTNTSVYPKFILGSHPVCCEDCAVIVEDSYSFRVGVSGEIDDC